MIEFVRTRQPQHAAEVSARWRSRGFIWTDLPALGGGGRSYSGASLGWGRLGGAAQIPNATASRLLIPAPPAVFDFSGDGTALLIYERTSTHSGWPTIYARVSNGFDSASAGRGGFALNNGTGNLYVFYRNAANSAWMETSAYSATLNTPHVWMMRKRGLALSIWRDGLLMQETTVAAHGPTPPSTTRVIYGVHDATTLQAAALIYLSAWSGAALSDGEIFNLSRNPWQLFAPHRTYLLPAGVPGGSDTKTITDAATGADALASIAVGLSIAEAGNGSDALPGSQAAAAVGDTGTGNDAVPALAAALGLADTGTGNDAAPTLAAALGLTDSGAGNDAVPVASALLGLADTATGADIIAALAAALGVADSGSGADALSVLTATLLTVTDAGSGADVVAALAAVAGVTDTGAGVDSIASIAVQLGLADSGFGTDAAAVAALLAVLDSAAGADALAVLQETLKTIADSGTATDGLALTVTVQLADSASGADALGAIAALLALADSAAGIDAVARFDAAVRLVAMTFTFRARAMVFAFARRSMTFSLAA